MRFLRIASLTVLALSAAGAAMAGKLSLGQPTVENGVYAFPVLLSGTESNGVAALDFTLEYDPSLFQAVSASPGLAAVRANKQVTANSPQSGEYIVVMMGLNQTVIQSGEVAQIQLQPIGELSGSSRLAITDPTLSDLSGTELTALGGTRLLTFTSDEENEEEEEEELDSAQEDVAESTDESLLAQDMPDALQRVDGGGDDGWPLAEHVSSSSGTPSPDQVRTASAAVARAAREAQRIRSGIETPAGEIAARANIGQAEESEEKTLAPGSIQAPSELTEDRKRTANPSEDNRIEPQRERAADLLPAGKAEPEKDAGELVIRSTTYLVAGFGAAAVIALLVAFRRRLFR